MLNFVIDLLHNKRSTPEHRIVDFSVHNHSFKHWPFTHNKFYHSVYQGEQIPTTTTQLKKMDSDTPLYQTTLDLSYYNGAVKKKKKTFC